MRSDGKKLKQEQVEDGSKGSKVEEIFGKLSQELGGKGLIASLRRRRGLNSK